MAVTTPQDVNPESGSGSGPLGPLLTRTYVAGPGHDREPGAAQSRGAIRAAAHGPAGSSDDPRAGMTLC